MYLWKSTLYFGIFKKITKNAIPENIEEVIKNVEFLRNELKEKISSQEKRMKIIHGILDYYKENNFQLSYDNLKEKMQNLINRH